MIRLSTYLKDKKDRTKIKELVHKACSNLLQYNTYELLKEKGHPVFCCGSNEYEEDVRYKGWTIHRRSEYKKNINHTVASMCHAVVQHYQFFLMNDFYHTYFDDKFTFVQMVNKRIFTLKKSIKILHDDWKEYTKKGKYVDRYSNEDEAIEQIDKLKDLLTTYLTIQTLAEGLRFPIQAKGKTPRDEYYDQQDWKDTSDCIRIIPNPYG